MVGDPTRTKFLREQFARFLSRLPAKVRKRIEQILENCDEINDVIIEQIKQAVEQEMLSSEVVSEIERYTWLFWRRGCDFALRQLKRYGIEITIPASLSVIDEDTVNQLKNLQLDLVKGLSEELKKKVAFHIRDSLLKGETIRQLAQRIQEVCDKTKYEAERIARTEATRVFNHAALDRYRKAGAKYYKYLAAMDARCCPKCAKNYGKIFKIDDPSAPRPPCHPCCRCAIIPVILLKNEDKISIHREAKEIAIQHYGRIVAKIPKGEVVPDEENLRKVIKLLVQDDRFKQLAEMLNKELHELAEKKAREALEFLYKHYKKDGIEDAINRLEKEGITLYDLVRLKNRKKPLPKEINGVKAILGKIRGTDVVIFVNKDNQIITTWKCTKRCQKRILRKYGGLQLYYR